LYLTNQDGSNHILFGTTSTRGVSVGGGTTSTMGARFGVKGSGTTSATTSLLVQNSAGTDLLKVTDDGSVTANTFKNGVLTLGSNILFGNAGIRLRPMTQSGGGVAISSAATPIANTMCNIKGWGNDATTTALLVQNSDGANLFKVDDSGFGFYINDDEDGKLRFYTDGQIGTISGQRNLRITSGGSNSININGSGTSGVIIGDLTNNLVSNVSLAVRGSGATSATTALLVQNSAGTDLLKVTDDGTATFVGSVNATSFNYSSVSSLGLYCRVTTTNPVNPQSRLFSAEGNNSATTKDSDSFSDIRNFTPTSGSALFTSFAYSGTINQTGTANGITRGVYINPTLTSAVDYRAIETTAGNVVFGNLPTSATGLPTGAIWNDGGTLKIA